MKRIFVGIITFVIIYVSILFQMEFLNSLPLVGVVANFGIVLIAGFGLISGKLWGGLIGSIYGMLMDVAFGRSIGIYISLYTLVGLLSGILNKSFSKGNKVSMIMMILICTTLFETIAYFLNIILNGFDLNLVVLIIKLTLESFYNVLLTLMFFKPISFWGEVLNKTKSSYYLL